MNGKTLVLLALTFSFAAKAMANENLSVFVKGLSLSMAAAGDHKGGMTTRNAERVLSKVSKTITESNFSLTTKKCLLDEFKDFRLMSFGSEYFNGVNSFLHNVKMDKDYIKSKTFDDLNEMSGTLKSNLVTNIEAAIELKKRMDREYEENLLPVILKCSN